MIFSVISCRNGQACMTSIAPLFTMCDCHKQLCRPAGNTLFPLPPKKCPTLLPFMAHAKPCVI